LFFLFSELIFSCLNSFQTKLVARLNSFKLIQKNEKTHSSMKLIS